MTWVILTCEALFVLTMGRAMSLYPGGTWLDRGTRGHRFWTNFLCDVMQPRALNDADNSRAATWARVAMLCLGMALLAFWHFVPTLFRDAVVLGWVVRVAGTISSLGLAGVIFFPSQNFPSLHGVFVLSAGGVGLGTAVAATVGLVQAGGDARGAGFLGVATLVVGGFDAVFFAQEHLGHLDTRLRTTVMQRSANLLALAWMAYAALL